MNKSTLLSISLATVATLWMLSGVFVDEKSVRETTESDPKAIARANLFKVKVTNSDAIPLAKEIRLQGVIQPAREVELRIETTGRISELLAQKGSRLNAGSPILQLDTNDRLARIKRAEAELDLRKAEHAANHTLARKKLVSANQLKRSQAQLAAAQADLMTLQQDMQHTQISAPFEGVLDTLNVEQGTYLVVGDNVGRLIDDSYSLITANVPQQSINTLNENLIAKVALPNGEFLTGEITYIGREANASTRTFPLEVKFPKHPALQYFGQSITMFVSLAEKPAHRISPALLELSASGQLHIKTLNQHNAVTSYPISILHSQVDAIWVTGLPPKATIITIGQGFVAEGQTVTPIYDSMVAEHGS